MRTQFEMNELNFCESAGGHVNKRASWWATDGPSGISTPEGAKLIDLYAVCAALVVYEGMIRRIDPLIITPNNL